MATYIYQYPNWPNFSWNDTAINALFGEVKLLQGKIMGQMNTLGFANKQEATLIALTQDVVKSSEIEGELLNYEQVRSSIARRLGLDNAGMQAASRHIEGIVDMMMDATQRHHLPLTHQRLFGWHAALFPTGFSGAYAIEVGTYRTGDMQIVSGAMGKEKIHYEAISHVLVPDQMSHLLDWLNNNRSLDPVLKAAIAHFWFIIIHPFDDGNGRIARAITDMLLARSENSGDRFYSMSNQIMAERKHYYQILQKVQHSTGDITEWLVWFLQCLKTAMLGTEETTARILRKAEFWIRHDRTPINERQRKILNLMFDGFEGRLQSSKWAKITKVSPDTALRDIKDLIAKNILQEANAGGRNAHYILNSDE